MGDTTSELLSDHYRRSLNARNGRTPQPRKRTSRRPRRQTRRWNPTVRWRPSSTKTRLNVLARSTSPENRIENPVSCDEECWKYLSLPSVVQTDRFAASIIHLCSFK